MIVYSMVYLHIGYDDVLNLSNTVVESVESKILEDDSSST